MEELAGALAAGLFPGKQRIGVDRGAIPPTLARRHRVDGEMEVRTGRARIAGVTDAGDHLTAFHLLPLGEARRIGREVRVVILPLLVRRALVNRDAPAPAAEEQFLDGTIGGG